MVWSFVILLTVFLHCANTAKILAISPVLGKSHYFAASGLTRGLAEKGHDVTVISPFGEKDPPKNGTYRDILIRDIIPTDDAGVHLSVNLFELGKMDFFTFCTFMNAYGSLLTDKTLSDPSVQKLINSGEKFDIVIVEQFIMDGLKVLSHHFQAHLVSYVTFSSSSWLNPYVANPGPPSYIPEQNILFDYKNFLHRVRNSLLYVGVQLNRHFILNRQQNRIMKKYFPDAPDLEILNYNASLVLLNSHVSTNAAVPRVPCMVDVGGIHLKPTKQLPQDLQTYLDNAPDGVIYFSMGSNLQSTNFPEEKRQVFLNVFSKLKEKVLWKWEQNTLPGQPSNVKVGKWLPQQDILAHPNVKAFVTHGGVLSLMETVHCGVPILSIPIFGDQLWNSVDAEKNGYARYILYDDLNEERLLEALNDLLTNSKYRENAKRRSQIMHDRRHSPIDEADYWINYVIRYQGATHLRVAGLELTWYQYLSLDVAAFVLGVVFLCIFLLYSSLKLCYRAFCKNINLDKIKQS